MIVRACHGVRICMGGSGPGEHNTKREYVALTMRQQQHDAVLDYYGRKLATCSSDRTVKIFEIEGVTQRLIETLKGLVVASHRNSIIKGSSNRLIR